MIRLRHVGVRIGRGIAQHFPIRRSEWIMLLPCFGMWAALHLQPDMFSTSPSYIVIDRWDGWASKLGWTAESLMAVVLICCGIVRLAALSINGTFHQFRFSPHLRACASLIGLAFWSQWTLGFVAAWLEGGALSGVVAYGTFCVMELTNVLTAAEDVGGEFKRLKLRREPRDRGL